MAPLRAYERAIRKQVSSGIIPGYCSIVIWRDQVIHVDAHGSADLERQCPMRTDSIVRLYCVTKSVVAIALMLLVERGKCSLEDDVAKFIPAFGDLRVVPPSPSGSDKPSLEREASPISVTLRQLLTHTSGLGYGKELNLPPEDEAEESYHGLVNAVEQGRVRSLEDFCERLAALPLRRPPGQGFTYSYGLDVIGRVIEVVSGQTLDMFLSEALFQPLGMCDTGFCVPRSKLDRLAALYGSYDTAQLLKQAPGKHPEERDLPAWTLFPLDGRSPAESRWAEGRHCSVLSGGGFMGHNRGGLVSTLNDLARLFLTIAKGGQLPSGARILQQSTVQMMVGQEWLRMPECLGSLLNNEAEYLPGVTNRGEIGWNALGELGMIKDPAKLGSTGYEFQEYGYGGIAETFWSVNPSKDLVLIWITQQVDNHSWTTEKASLWVAARKAVAGVDKRKRKRTSSCAGAEPRRRLTGKTSQCKV